MKTVSKNNESDDNPSSNLKILISPHLKKLISKSPAISKQFTPSNEENKVSNKALIDPLKEDDYIKTKGLVHKYSNRILIELTLQCASYCRFCTRRRIVSDIKNGHLTSNDLKNIVAYLSKHQEINEIVISGGDPFTVPTTLSSFISKVKKISHIKIIRIHTRVPVSNPKIIPAYLFQTLKSIKKALFISIHFEHPDEITKSTINIIKKIKSAGAILLSQSVFLKGVNDSYETLYKLFTKLAELGIRPYYIYRCDPVIGAEHFIVPFEKEIEIMTKLRKNLSGIACPLYVIDTPNGSGKIPVPLNFWKFGKESFTDFNDKKIDII